MNYPIAPECALKLKEISYIHAEGYAAAEVKHGPIALIDEGLPVVMIATQGYTYLGQKQRRTKQHLGVSCTPRHELLARDQ